jgi:hypothetical protein
MLSVCIFRSSSFAFRVADPSQKENLGIIVQYKVKVKLCLGALGGYVQLPRALICLCGVLQLCFTMECYLHMLVILPFSHVLHSYALITANIYPFFFYCMNSLWPPFFLYTTTAAATAFYFLILCTLFSYVHGHSDYFVLHENAVSLETDERGFNIIWLQLCYKL